MEVSLTAARISAVIPVHDRSGLLEEAVESLVATRYGDLEIVIVEDGGGEETAARARALAERHPGVVRTVRHPDGRNHGPGASRNRGVQVSTGEYICFLDADDIVLPNRFARAPSALDADAALDGVGERFLREEGSPRARTASGDRRGLTEALLGPGIRWHTSSILLRRRCFLDVGGFSESLRTSEDWVLWVKLALVARIGDGGAEPVAVYRRHGENTAPVLENSLLAFLEVMRWSKARGLGGPRVARVRSGAWGKLLYVCDRLRRQGRRRRAAAMLAAAAAAEPSFALRVGFWRNLIRCALPARTGS
ncbi:MAG TPA: glycosyltransferase family A protein [Gemmatimonadota bacterium]|jgi:glycosyltransferase involved in cell wall biosynthesis